MQSPVDVLHRLARRRAVHRLVAHPRVEWLVALIKRSGMVRPGRTRFVARELLHRRVAVRYRLRTAPGVTVLVRHGTPDVVTLDEVFLTQDYRIPPPAATALEAAPGPLRVLDLGANAGYFGAFVLARFPDAKMVGFEPDAANVAALHETIAANRAEERWEVVAACAGASDGTVQFVSGAYSLSHLAAARTASVIDGSVGRVRCVDVFPHLAEADLVKIDIEGGEWEIICDPRFPQTSARAIVLEYHPALCPGDDPRTTARQALTGAGFEIVEVWQRADGHGVLWGWRPT